MLIYIFILLVIINSMLLNIDINKKVRKQYVIIIFMILTAIAMFRSYKVGVDTLQYYRNFNIIANLNWSDVDILRYEPGYFYFCKVLSEISKDPHILIMVSSLIIIPSVGRFIYKYSKNVALSIFLYITLNIYFFHLTGMRQSIAIAILLYGIGFLIEGKYIKYSLVVILAAQFHSSAIFLLCMILIRKSSCGKKTYIRMLIISLLGFVFYNQIFKLASILITKYEGYADSIFGESNYFGALLMFLVYFIIYSICQIYQFRGRSQYKFEDNVIGKIAFRSLSIAVCLQVITMRMNIIGRMVPYFIIFAIIAVPDAISRVKSKKFIVSILIIVMLLFTYWLVIGLFRPEWNGAIPYLTIFNDIK